MFKVSCARVTNNTLSLILFTYKLLLTMAISLSF